MGLWLIAKRPSPRPTATPPLLLSEKAWLIINRRWKPVRHRRHSKPGRRSSTSSFCSANMPASRETLRSIGCGLCASLFQKDLQSNWSAKPPSWKKAKRLGTPNMASSTARADWLKSFAMKRPRFAGQPHTDTAWQACFRSSLKSKLMSEIIRDILNLPSGPTRFRALKAAWDGLHTHGLELDRRGQAIAGNSYSSTLTTAFLMDGAVTDLQNRWAALAAFSVNFSTDPYKPKATGELKHVTVGSTTGTDLTNFETGTAADATVVPATVVMHQYTQPFQVSNTDLQSGLRMGDLVTINSALFANKVIEVGTAPT